MLDALEEDADALRELKPLVCVEIGYETDIHPRSPLTILKLGIWMCCRLSWQNRSPDLSEYGLEHKS
jgi:hypothetical protein